MTTIMLLTDARMPSRMESAPSEGPGSFFEVFDRRWKGSGAQHEGQILGRFLAEVAGNASGIVNAALDVSGFVNLVIEDDSHASIHGCLLFSERSKASGGGVGELEIDLILAGIVRAGARG